MTFRFDDVLGMAVRDVESMARKVGPIDHEAIASARVNPALQKAIALLDQSINRSRDQLIATGRVDPGNHRLNVSGVEDARKQITGLALALAVGMRIIDATEKAFDAVFVESEQVRAREIEARNARTAQEFADAESAARLDREPFATVPMAESGPVPVINAEPIPPDEPSWEIETNPGPGPEFTSGGIGGVEPDAGSGPAAGSGGDPGPAGDRVEPGADPARVSGRTGDRRGKGRS